MKKILATILMLMVFAVMLPIGADAQTYTTRRVYGTNRTVRVYKKRSFYKRHRKVVNTVAGTGGGAIIGGLLGGKKGAIIGGLAGAGGATIYNHKTRKKHRRY